MTDAEARAALAADERMCATLACHGIPPGFKCFPDGIHEDDDDDATGATRLCSPLRVTAAFGDLMGRGCGRIVEILDARGIRQTIRLLRLSALAALLESEARSHGPRQIRSRGIVSAQSRRQTSAPFSWTRMAQSRWKASASERIPVVLSMRMRQPSRPIS